MELEQNILMVRPRMMLSGVERSGVRSVVRERIVGDGESPASGHLCYRAVVPAEQMPEELRARDP